MMRSMPLKNNLVIVIIGRPEMGKTTLFNSLMGETVVKKRFIKRQYIDSPVLDKKHLINTIDVRLVDTPGLGISNGETAADIMEKIVEKVPGSGEDVNLVICCVSMAKDSQLTETDREIASELSKIYAGNIWEKALFALTFANLSKEEAKTSLFNEQVADCTKSVRTELLTGSGNVSKEVADDIPILPVGYFMAKEKKGDCTLPDGSNWLSNFWYQSLMRIRDPQARYAFYLATSSIHRYLRDSEHYEVTQV